MTYLRRSLIVYLTLYLSLFQVPWTSAFAKGNDDKKKFKQVRKIYRIVLIELEHFTTKLHGGNLTEYEQKLAKAIEVIEQQKATLQKLNVDELEKIEFTVHMERLVEALGKELDMISQGPSHDNVTEDFLEKLMASLTELIDHFQIREPLHIQIYDFIKRNIWIVATVVAFIIIMAAYWTMDPNEDGNKDKNKEPNKWPKAPEPPQENEKPDEKDPNNKNPKEGEPEAAKPLHQVPPVKLTPEYIESVRKKLLAKYLDINKRYFKRIEIEINHDHTAKESVIKETNLIKSLNKSKASFEKLYPNMKFIWDFGKPTSLSHENNQIKHFNEVFNFVIKKENQPQEKVRKFTKLLIYDDIHIVFKKSDPTQDWPSEKIVRAFIRKLEKDLKINDPKLQLYIMGGRKIDMLRYGIRIKFSDLGQELIDEFNKIAAFGIYIKAKPSPSLPHLDPIGSKNPKHELAKKLIKKILPIYEKVHEKFIKKINDIHFKLDLHAIRTKFVDISLGSSGQPLVFAWKLKEKHELPFESDRKQMIQEAVYFMLDKNNSPQKKKIKLVKLIYHEMSIGVVRRYSTTQWPIKKLHESADFLYKKHNLKVLSQQQITVQLPDSEKINFKNVFNILLTFENYGKEIIDAFMKEKKHFNFSF